MEIKYLPPNEQYLLKEWPSIIQASFISKAAEKYLDVKVVMEVSSVSLSASDQDLDWEIYLNELTNYAPFKEQNVFSFVVLENGYAVGLNENPHRGWGFPVIKYKGSIT